MSNGVCEACGGVASCAIHWAGCFGVRTVRDSPAERRRVRAGGVGEWCGFARDSARGLGSVVEAGRLNGRKPLAWAVDALDNAARHQVHKASKKRTARSRSSVKRRVPLECKSGERRSQRPERTDVLDRPASRERSRRNND